MENGKWKNHYKQEGYRFQLRMSDDEKGKLEKLIKHFNTNKTLLLRKFINGVYKALGEKNE